MVLELHSRVQACNRSAELTTNGCKHEPAGIHVMFTLNSYKKLAIGKKVAFLYAVFARYGGVLNAGDL
ncbi:hypothetical protein KSMBR1_1040 [Candidatus Kuenenia stuttgartiensis]|uniref:Uncharacterized protein n=1 Tax=Kuenenia stuttgartiensis TaxID=174633 RepID=A0A2C9CD85_KUEST|nr:hypothetical protein KSMBR1_1040 [Candidatus Kuenenia stuttgartiensis]